MGLPDLVELWLEAVLVFVCLGSDCFETSAREKLLEQAMSWLGSVFVVHFTIELSQE